MGGQRIFNSDAHEAFFLLGGIGTGNVSIGARGQLADWEIFNRPNKGSWLANTFFAIYAKPQNRPSIARVLESRLHPPYSAENKESVPGLPRLRDSRMRGEYPFVWIDFEDDALPLDITLEAFTPFIPLDPEDSGLPCAVFNYRVKNLSSESVDVSIVGSLLNPVGICDMDRFGWPQDHDHSKNMNELKSLDGISGLFMYATHYSSEHFKYGNICLSTPESEVTAKPYWYSGGWFDGIQEFWDDFQTDGLLEERTMYSVVESDITKRTASRKPRVGSLGVPKRLEPGDEAEFRFVLSWYFPNRVKAWYYDRAIDDTTETIRNHYATRFGNAWDVATYVHKHMARLDATSRLFHDAVYNSTLPEYVIDAAASSITVIRSQTCMWLETGYLAAWEGCEDTRGGDFGTCTHVWNYAQTLAFLFPSLERSAREIEFCYETDESGEMAFRTNTVFGLPRWQFHPATDGQLGALIRLYREWKFSGDTDFLRKLWGGAKRALEYAIRSWDTDGDCVLDGKQHNTYDIEFYGISSMLNSLFFAALKAGAEMATAMGDDAAALEYNRILRAGSKRMDALLWNGEYYIQKIDNMDDYKYQYGDGCLSDQLLGQMLAHVTGLGYILPEEHVKSAVKAIYDYNFTKGFFTHHNIYRAYALNDETGLLICSWPNGGRPIFPFVYSDEVWSGIEYQVAAHLIYEGFVDEGLSVVKAVRDRYDGYKRNPWNEVEAGNQYARSMSAWAVITALSGFKCDMVNREIHFSPRTCTEDFSVFWSTGEAWGTFNYKHKQETGDGEYTIDVLFGDLDGVAVYVNGEVVA